MPRKIIPNENQLTVIKSLAKKGCSMSHIAEEVMIDRSAIKRILTEYNIKVKNTSKSNMGKKYNWTEEKEKKLREMYLNENIFLNDICKEFKLSESAIVKKAKQLGISKKRDYFNWTCDSLRKLKAYLNNEDLTMPNIAFLLNITEPVIRGKMKELNLKKVKTRLFTIDEVHYIKRNKDIKSDIEIANDLNRSIESVKIQLLKSGKVIKNSRRKEMPESEEFKKDIGDPMLSDSVLSRKYSVSAAVIKRWRKELFGTFKTMVDTWRCKTTSEIDFEEILEELDLAYIFHKKILGWNTDFYLGNKLIIEIYSSYYHKKIDKVKKKDERALKELRSKGYTVITIWDYELTNKDNVKKIVLENYANAVLSQLPQKTQDD